MVDSSELKAARNGSVYLLELTDLRLEHLLRTVLQRIDNGLEPAGPVVELRSLLLKGVSMRCQPVEVR